VAALGLNVQVERLEGEKQRLLSERAELSSRLSSAAAAGRIERIARGELGLSEPVQTTYVRLPPRSK